MNHTAIYDNIVRSKIDISYNEQVVRNTLGMIGDEGFETPKNPVELDKYLSKKYSTSMQRYTYLRIIEFDHYSRLFKNQEIDGELLLLICRTFHEQIICNEAFNNEEEQDFVCRFLTTLATVSTSFEFVLEFLGDEERTFVSNLIDALTLVDTN